MGEIKSSLELALERTAGVKADKDSIRTHELKQEGQKLASQVLSGQETEPAQKLKKYSGKDLAPVKDGYIQTIFANLTLPQNEEALGRLESIRDGLSAVLSDKKQSSTIYEHLKKFFTQYLSDSARLEESLKSQFAGKLRIKEDQLSRQAGTPVKLNIATDPDYLKALHQNRMQLDGQYGQALNQMKDQLKGMLR